MNTTQLGSTGNRSTFVTVVAWIFIILGAFATLISLLQNIMVGVMFTGPEFEEAMAASSQSQDVPVSFNFMFNYFHLFFAALLLVSAGTLVSAIGLLKRKNWARLIFIGIMTFGIVWNIVGLIMQFFIFTAFPEIPSGMPEEQLTQFNNMTIIMLVFASITTLGMSALFGWIIHRLVSVPVKLEFGVGIH